MAEKSEVNKNYIISSSWPNLSFGIKLYITGSSAAVIMVLISTARWLNAAPLGCPVVPDV